MGWGEPGALEEEKGGPSCSDMDLGDGGGQR